MITASTLSNNTLTVILDNGDQILSATKDHPQWSELVNAYSRHDETAMLELLNMKRVVEKFSNGGLVVADNGVFYKDMPLGGVDVERIMAFMRQGLPYRPIANYMVRKMGNPSRRAINEMYNFLEHRQMPLTAEGKIIGYKGVQKDFFSVSSGNEPLVSGKRNETGQIFFGIGETIEMVRSYVNDDFRQGCSNGIHVGSLSYARDWAQTHNGIIILIEFDPADVVSVPSDCDCSKCRICKCKVISVYNGPLPDTYTADYTKVCSDEPTNSNEFPEETCEYCGELEDDCRCVRCEKCNEREVNCTCKPVEPPQEEKKENPSIRERFSAIICEQGGVDPAEITDDKRFTELGFDSLDQVELTIAVESEFGIAVTDEEAEQCTTVGRAIEALTKALTPQSVQPVAVPYTDVKQQYDDGYDLGKRNGIRRRKRLYRDGDENNKLFITEKEYIKGYNRGYRDGRKDYSKK